MMLIYDVHTVRMYLACIIMSIKSYQICVIVYYSKLARTSNNAAVSYTCWSS